VQLRKKQKTNNYSLQIQKESGMDLKTEVWNIIKHIISQGIIF
jgi:hypothetical protein